MHEKSIFHINNVPIYIRDLPSGAISIWHPFNENLRDIIEPICRGHGYWDSAYRNWIIFAYFKDLVLAELRKL